MTKPTLEAAEVELLLKQARNRHVPYSLGFAQRCEVCYVLWPCETGAVLTALDTERQKRREAEQKLSDCLESDRQKTREINIMTPPCREAERKARVLDRLKAGTTRFQPGLARLVDAWIREAEEAEG